MAVLTRYIATHDETGEVIIGTAKELAFKLGVIPGTVYKTAMEGNQISAHWSVEKEKQKREVKNDYKFLLKQQNEWDAITKPFKEASRRAGGADA